MNFGDRLAVPLCLLCAVAACERGDDDASGPSDDDQAADDDQADDDVADDDAANPEIALTDWRLSSADGIADGGAAISQVGYDDAGWNAATVPATVLAALVADGVYPDPYYGVNLHELPGLWPMGFDVSVFPMPSDSPFRRPWWHRAEFHAPVASPDDRYWLRFEGLNFRADLWLNGRRVADRKQVAGAFREYEFDVTDFVRSGADNALAAEIIAPTVHDLAYNWVDWGPGPPDKNMGLYRAVKLLVTGPVALRYPQVVSKLELPGMASARLTVFADLWNGSAQPVDGVLHGELEGVEFSQAVSLTAGERRRVELAPGDHPELVIDDPRVWWPLNLGEQNLYQMTLDFRTGEKISDRQTVSFGIRDVQAPLTEEGCRYYAINGRKE
jgi:exo-1,4-beta-D-glucosaminidase